MTTTNASQPYVKCTICRNRASRWLRYGQFDFTVRMDLFRRTIARPISARHSLQCYLASLFCGADQQRDSIRRLALVVLHAFWSAFGTPNPRYTVFSVDGDVRVALRTLVDAPRAAHRAVTRMRRSFSNLIVAQPADRLFSSWRLDHFMFRYIATHQREARSGFDSD